MWRYEPNVSTALCGRVVALVQPLVQDESCATSREESLLQVPLNHSVGEGVVVHMVVVLIWTNHVTIS